MISIISDEKRVVLISGNLFVEPELLYSMYRLEEAGVKVTVATFGKNPIKGLYGYTINPDFDIASLKVEDFEVFTPSGGSPYELRRDQKTLEFLRGMHKKNVIASICRGVLLLVSAGIMKGKKTTTWTDVADDLKNSGVIFEDLAVVKNGNIVTSRVPSDLPKFLYALIDTIKWVGGSFNAYLCCR
ncbi:MAG: DJ-1/PfpI family protein [Nitrososphaeria archaeon]